MKKRFSAYTPDGEIARKKLEKLFLKAGFIKIDDWMFWGEQCDVLSITKQLYKENIDYAICPISLSNGKTENQKAGTELPF
ncbi:hypothetical protein [Clostridium sp. DJ247]|uniref:hypothetical protein n=1 Tax=Clostridium sp. DJ247 TaxID=2726188 RepID=UPI001626EC4E|nr:hypothetical protein [Clostridium sp. DJ247]MBC2580848.1 hypothetical protein [Clostridium sp. DJ247]